MRLRYFRSGIMLGWIMLVIIVPYSSNAEQVYSDVRGSVEMTDPTYYKKVSSSYVPTNACWSAPGETPGMTCMNSAWEMYEDLAGGLSMFAMIDGIEVASDILPTGSYYRIGFQTRIKPYACTPPYYCFGFPCGVEYHIGNAAGFVNGSVFQWIDLPVVSGTGTGFFFSFSFCNHDFIIGCACGVVGSASNKATLHTPAPVNAHLFPGGPGSYTFPSGFALDFQYGPGGTVTSTKFPGDPPVPAYLPHYLPGYWEMRTDMDDYTYSTSVTMPYNPTEIPDGYTENQLFICRFNAQTGLWEGLTSIIDSDNNRITAENIECLSLFAVAFSLPLPTKNTSWGAIKTLYK